MLRNSIGVVVIALDFCWVFHFFGLVRTGCFWKFREGFGLWGFFRFQSLCVYDLDGLGFRIEGISFLTQRKTFDVFDGEN